jgi:hypothetical protein
VPALAANGNNAATIATDRIARIFICALTPELSRAAKRRRLE